MNSPFSGSQVLVTGGFGSIGSHVARRLLEAGADVTIVDSGVQTHGANAFNVRDILAQVEVCKFDVCDAGLEKVVRDKTYVFHLAGQSSHLDSMRDPAADLHANVSATVALLDVCRRVNPGVRIVTAGTRQVYGRPCRIPVGESHPLSPLDINGVHKIAIEHYHRIFWEIYGIQSTVLRLTNTYGPGMRIKDTRQTFLGIWLRRLVEGQPLQIYGDGLQIRDLNYVSDVVDAMLGCAAAPVAVGQIYNLGTGEGVTLSDLAEQMICIHGSGSVEYVPFPRELRKIDIGDYVADIEQIRGELGWAPQVNLNEGLSRTIRYYAEHLTYYLDESDAAS